MVLAEGRPPAGTKTAEAAQQMMFNARLDAVVALVFMGVAVMVDRRLHPRVDPAGLQVGADGDARSWRGLMVLFPTEKVINDEHWF